MNIFNQKKGVSPLIATVLLVFLSIALGAVVMTFGEAYIGENAGFAKGEPEVGLGCETIKFDITTISGVPHVCIKERTLDISLDNGPSTVVDDFHARIHGSEGVSNVQNLLNRPLERNAGVRLRIPYEYVGKPVKVVITPIKKTGGALAYCTEKSIQIENLPECS